MSTRVGARAPAIGHAALVERGLELLLAIGAGHGVEIGELTGGLAGDVAQGVHGRRQGLRLGQARQLALGGQQLGQPGGQLSAPRFTAAAGLFSSCAMPAVRVPSWASFSAWRNIEPVARQRASTVKNMTRAAEALVCSSSSSSGLVDAQQQRGAAGARGGAARDLLQQGGLADDVAGGAHGQQHLATGRLFQDLELALGDDVRLVAGLALGEQGLAGRRGALP